MSRRAILLSRRVIRWSGIRAYSPVTLPGIVQQQSYSLDTQDDMLNLQATEAPLCDALSSRSSAWRSGVSGSGLCSAGSKGQDALQEVKVRIEAVGDRVAGEEHEKHPGKIPNRAEHPTEVVTPGSEVIDGVRLSFILLQHAETDNALMVGLPEQKILITQDLVYHGVHVFIAEKAFDAWIAGLRHYKRGAARRAGGPSDDSMEHIGDCRECTRSKSGDE